MGIYESTSVGNIENITVLEKTTQLLLPHLTVDLVSEDSLERPLVERHIKNHFFKAYKADVTTFLPFILSARTKKQITSTLGFRVGKDEQRFFLEHYLSTDVESTLSGLLNKPIARNKIAEIGSLTSNFPSISHTLFVLVVSILYRAGFQWALFTATTQVVKMIADLELATITVCDAVADSLPDSGQSWGGYYENKPKVIAGDLETAYRNLSQHPVSSFMINNYQQTIDEIVGKIKNHA